MSGGTTNLRQNALDTPNILLYFRHMQKRVLGGHRTTTMKVIPFHSKEKQSW